jgi:hypothetical protein
MLHLDGGTVRDSAWFILVFQGTASSTPTKIALAELHKTEYSFFLVSVEMVRNFCINSCHVFNVLIKRRLKYWKKPSTVLKKTGVLHSVVAFPVYLRQSLFPVLDEV